MSEGIVDDALRALMGRLVVRAEQILDAQEKLMEGSHHGEVADLAGALESTTASIQNLAFVDDDQEAAG